MTTPTLYKFIESELFKMGHDHEIVDKAGNLVFFDNDHQVMSKILSYDDDVVSIMDNLFLGHALDNEVYDYHFKKTFFYRFINRQINRQTIESFKMELISTFMQNQSFINRVYGDMEKYITQTSTGDSTNKNTNTENRKELNTGTSTSQDSNNSKENVKGSSDQLSTTDNIQSVDGTTTTDNRQARSDLPQNTVNLNVDNSTMTTANENEISRNKQTNAQDTDSNSTTDTKNNNNSETTGETSGETSSNTTGELEGNTTGESEGVTNTLNQVYQLDELFKTNGVMGSIYNVFDIKCFLQTW